VVAGHPQCPLPVLQRLADDDLSEVCGAVAANRGCTPQLLSQLARRTWAEHPGARARVLVSVINNRQVTSAILRQADLMDVKLGTAVHQALVRCPACPPEVLGWLAGTVWTGVSDEALAHPSCPVRLLWDKANGASSSRSAVTRNPACPSELLDRLARDDHRTVRRFVGSNSATPPGTLVCMLGDRDDAVRRAVQSNPALPVSALAMWQLAHDGTG